MKNKRDSIKIGLLILCILAMISAIKSSPALYSNFNNNITNIKNYVSNNKGYIGNGSITSEAAASRNKILVENYDEYNEVLKETLSNYESSVVIEVKDYDEDIYNNIPIENVTGYHEALSANYEWTLSRQDLRSSTLLTFNFIYHEPKETLISKEKAVKIKVQEIIKEVITPEMKDYEKEKAIHDYVVNNCIYDERYYTGGMPDESYSAYGVLIDGIGVCQGYAIAMNLLLKEVGIESLYIHGEAFDYNTNTYGNHAWNLVKIQGNYYHLDATWNDPLMEDGSNKVQYSYFNITDEQISENHKWDKSDYPECTSSQYSFDNLNFIEKDIFGNDIIVVQDYEEFSASIQGAISEMKPNTTYKIIDFDEDAEKIKYFINNAFANAGINGKYTCFYSIDTISKCGYLTVEFSW